MRSLSAILSAIADRAIAGRDSNLVSQPSSCILWEGVRPHRFGHWLLTSDKVWLASELTEVICCLRSASTGQSGRSQRQPWRIASFQKYAILKVLLPMFGDGLKRALLIALTILNITDGILLIDEIETSLHVSILSKVFTWLIEICRRRNIQLFLTTHSLEAIDAMLQPDIAIDRIVAFRLNSMGQPAQRFSGDLLYRLRSERGLDVR
ncbi:ATP-binding protein [bacterium]|nr:ATP-binding protein [bacterium]